MYLKGLRQYPTLLIFRTRNSSPYKFTGDMRFFRDRLKYYSKGDSDDGQIF